MRFRYGKVLIEKYETFKGAKTEINERILCIKSHWKRTTLQLIFIQHVWEALDAEHQNLQNQILQVLMGKLRIAISQIGKVEKEKSNHSDDGNPVMGLKRWKYVLHLKQSLDKAIEELDAWQKMFDPSWFLIMKVANPLIDAELTKKHTEIASFSTAHRLRDALREEPQINVH